MRCSKSKNKLLLILFFYLTIFSFGQNDINFKHIVPQINNRNVFISQTTQDALGNIWMISGGGVLKYNGYSYHFISKEEIFTSISSEDGIDYFVADQDRNIWIKTNRGLLAQYNFSQGTFIDYSSLFKSPVNVINSKDNSLWVVTSNGNLYYLKDANAEMIATIPNINGIDLKAQSIEFGNTQEVYISTDKGKIYNYSVKSKRLSELTGPFTDYPTPVFLQADNFDRLWIGTEAFGLLIYDIQSKTFIQNEFFKENAAAISKELFLNLFLDSKDNIWGGTDGDGLYKINSKTGEINIYKKENANEFSLSSNTILNINEDNQHNIWAVTKYGTIDVVPQSNQNVHYHKGSANNRPVEVLSMFKSKAGKLWIGTDGEGLTIVDESAGLPKQFFNEDNHRFYVQSITEDDEENIWFGTYKNGLWRYDVKQNTFKRIPVVNNKNQQATDVRTVFKDSKNRIWVGSNVALNLYNTRKQLIASFRNHEHGLKGYIAESIIEDDNQNIWIGIQGGGLFKFNEDLNNIRHSSFTNFKNDFNENMPRVTSMCIGKPNEIWFVNGFSKLVMFNTELEKFLDFNHINSLKTSVVNGLTIQDPNNLWLSTTNGILHFNREKEIVKTYYTTDGFQSNSFMYRSVYKDKDGLLYFGSKEGFNYFNPKRLTKQKADARLFINDIRVLNKPAKVILPEQITSDIFNLKELRLKNSQSSFSIKFSAIGNILNPNFSYSYKLKGFDQDWKTTNLEGLATYTNVPPGNYTFEIKAYEMNEDTLISTKKLGIKIDNPLWNSPLAYGLYVILLGLLVYGAMKWYSLRKKLLISKISRRKENELYEAKMNFFTKMSHEIQTPITLILGPIEDMLKRAELNGNMLLKERLSIISNNALRLSRIARELTLTRNRELNRLKLSVTSNDLYLDISKVCLSFKELARSKKIDFSINCPKNLTDAWYDKEKLEHILYNLLSNAFKYTPSEGNVQLSVLPLRKKNAIKISITDSGQGIEKEELKNIFKIFYRSENNTDANGAGIGLALTKELVTLHKGKIKVNSKSGEGATFTVKIPISEDSYADNEKITSSQKSTTLLSVNEAIVNEQNNGHDNTKKTILIVEDNFELQSFVKGLFQDQYNILLAENGKEGFYHAKNNIPDLIISDIMMPEMDGIEMCKALNDNKLTMHIPIVLLTAKNSTKAKIEGLETGAIEYINKPFNTNELLLKVNNILTSKENIISKYRKELINKPEIKINKSQDEIFLEKLVSIVNERLKDSTFKVDDLAEILNMSHSSLYRKCLSITGLKLVDFIKSIRLKKAAVLMSQYGYTISETAYMVGFNDPKYFSKSFKRHFSVTPKEFKQRASSSPDIESFLKEYGIDANHHMDGMNKIN